MKKESLLSSKTLLFHTLRFHFVNIQGLWLFILNILTTDTRFLCTSSYTEDHFKYAAFIFFRNIAESICISFSHNNTRHSLIFTFMTLFQRTCDVDFHATVTWQVWCVPHSKLLKGWDSNVASIKYIYMMCIDTFLENNSLSRLHTAMI